MADLGTTYSPDNQYQQKIDAARSVAGNDNPEAIRQALAKTAIAGDTQLQTAVQGQQAGITALQQMADYDRKLAAEAQANIARQQAASQQVRQQTMAMGATAPSNAAQTIAMGPATFDINTFAPSTPGTTSPTVYAGLVQGQNQAAQGTYDMAAQLRGSRERIIGSEVEAMTRLYQAQQEEKRRQEELERMRKEQEQKEKMLQFERERQYAEAQGGTVVDPITGKEYKYMSPQEKAEFERRNAAQAAVATGGYKTDGQGYRNLPQDQKNIIIENATRQLGDKGTVIRDALLNGTTSIAEIIRSNPQLSPAQRRALAEISSTKWGGFTENDDQLRAMGYNPGDVQDLRAGVSGGANQRQSIIDQAFTMTGAADLINQGKDAGSREAIASAIIKAGSVDNYKKSVGFQDKPTYTPAQEKMLRANKTVEDSYIGVLRGLEELKNLSKKYTLMNIFDPSAKADFDTKKELLAQLIGKVYEGGRMTDSDRDFYQKLVAGTGFVGWQPATENSLIAVAQGLAQKNNLDYNAIKEKVSLVDQLPRDQVTQAISQMQPGDSLYYNPQTGEYLYFDMTEVVPTGLVPVRQGQ